MNTASTECTLKSNWSGIDAAITCRGYEFYSKLIVKVALLIFSEMLSCKVSVKSSGLDIKKGDKISISDLALNMDIGKDFYRYVTNYLPSNVPSQPAPELIH